MIPETNEIRIENCTLCNYSCQFCPHSTNAFTRKREVMSDELYKKIIDKTALELPQITEVTVSGFGEAFLDKGIINKIYYAKNRGYRVHVVTNGSRLTKEVVDHLLYVIDDIRISLHTTVEENYIKITGARQGQLQHILDMIDYISTHSLKKQSRIIITADIIKENKNDLDKLINDLGDKVDLIEAWKPHNWVTWGSYRKGPVVKETCGRPWNTPIQVQVDGTVNMCCFDFNGELLLGDLKTQSFKEIFSGEEVEHIRECHSSIEKIKSCDLICSQCDQIRDTGSIVLYNNKYSEKDRIGKTSTNYRSLK